jgi:hypothetical protein
MAILTRDNIVAAASQCIQFTKTGTLANTVGLGWHSPFAVAGTPGAGTLAGLSTAAGVVPTDAVGGYPLINAFGGGADGVIDRINFASTVACRIAIFDRLFVAGAYAFNANTALSGQPDFSARVPNTDYKGLELWVEGVTDSTGNLAVNVSYENETGVGGGVRTTGATGIGAVVRAGRCFQLPFQAGDRGISKITNVAGSVASAGTFNVMILRRLWAGRVKFAGDGDVHDYLKTGLPRVYADSALYMMIAPDSTAIGVPDVCLDVSNG